MASTSMKPIASLVLVTVIGVLAGCAAPASRESMAPTTVSVAKNFPYTVAVETRGGSETSSTGISNISDADLKAAIENSIERSNLFRSIVQGKGADYELTVTLVPLVRPLIGFSFTVDMEAGWALVRAVNKSVVMRKSIKSPFTATMGDSMAGVTRMRLAIEGAARSNVEQGLQAIAELNL